MAFGRRAAPPDGGGLATRSIEPGATRCDAHAPRSPRAGGRAPWSRAAAGEAAPHGSGRVLGRWYCLLVLACAAGAGCRGAVSATPAGDRYAAAITAVLAEDKAASDRCRAADDGEKPGAVRDYVKAVHEIDLRGCPPEFQEAFLRHAYAWDEVIPFLDKYDGLIGAAVTLFEYGSAVSAGTLTTEKDRALERIRRGIALTYLDVERVALRHGVRAGH